MEDVKVILIGVTIAVISELIIIAIKSMYKQGVNKDNKKNRFQFSLETSKQRLVFIFYSLLIFVAACILSILFIDFEQVLGIKRSTGVMVASMFGTMSLINLFIAFHESLAHWDENKFNNEPADTIAESE